RRLVIDEALGRAVTERVDLGPIALAADERIVLRDRAVVVVAQDLAGQAVRVLRHLAGLTPGADEQRAVLHEQQAGNGRGTVRLDDVLDVRQRRAVEDPARDGQRSRAAATAAATAAAATAADRTALRC